MENVLLKKLARNKSSLNALLEFSYDCVKPHVDLLSSSRGYLFQRQIVTEAYLAFLGIEPVNTPYKLLPEWSELTGIPVNALEAYLDLITINLELVRNSPNPLEALRDKMQNV